MRRFLWFITLVFLWMILQDEITLLNLCFGIVIALIISYLMRKNLPLIPTRPLVFLKFSIYMFFELIKSNYRVARDVLSLHPKRFPGIIKFNLKTQNEDQTVWLANMISLTPGTLILDISKNQKSLYVHVMFLKNRPEIEKELRALERRVMELFPA